MALAAGTRLGPYEIVNPLGTGGMGEVYRARDTRLGREVAVKVLPAELSADSNRLRRFEQEARSASALNHPNIVTLHDIGLEGSVSYIAMELVDGKTLRELLLAGPLPIKKLLQIAPQVADGLAKAHEAGIVHRDLKPENLMVTGDGRVKILDFGLAKVTQPDSDSGGSESLTVTRGTEPGIVMGTVGYMSPEQASGHTVDYRSDQFSFGSVLYEMATGKRAFEGKTKPEILAAIIRDEPQPIGAVNPRVPAPLRWIVEQCLAKEPKDRYSSTEDLARDLVRVRDHISEVSGSIEVYAPQTRRRRRFLVVALAAAISAAAASGYLARSAVSSQPKPPSFHRLTFRRGNVSGARFSPDGRTIVYSAAWDGKPPEIFLTRRESSDSRSLGFPGAHLLSVSSGTELALASGWQWDGFTGVGTLARASLLGGEPRQLVEGVEDADWSPDGKSLAVVRRRPGKSVLEFPIGRTLYENPSWGVFFGIRVSPGGDLVAFIDATRNTVTEVSVVDTTGRKRTLSSGWVRAQGVAWPHDGKEVWFTATKAGLTTAALWAVTLSGRERLVTEVPGRLRLEDIAADGSVLFTHETVRREMVGLAPGETRERDLTWLGYAFPANLSRDGRTLLFSEWSEGAGPSTLYVRGTDGSPPIRIGTGEDALLSPDGKWVVVWKPAPGAKLGPEGRRWEILPTGAGESRPFRVEGLAISFVVWFPDGKHLLVSGEAPGKASRDYIVDLDGKNPRPLTPEGVSNSVISPDGNRLAGEDEKGISIYSVGGGQVYRVPGAAPEGAPIQWAADGKSLYLYYKGIPGSLEKLDLATGRRQPWKEFLPADPTGVLLVQPLVVTPDGSSYVYTYVRVLSDLYLVEGLR